MRENSLKGTNSSNRNYFRWHGITQQLPSTNGSLAFKPKYQPPPAFRRGMELARGAIKIVGLLFVAGEWVYHVAIKLANGMTGFVKNRTRREVWQLRKRICWQRWRELFPDAQRSEAGTDATPAPASRMLPAPRNTIAGLLPAVCA